MSNYNLQHIEVALQVDSIGYVIAYTLQSQLRCEATQSQCQIMNVKAYLSLCPSRFLVFSQVSVFQSEIVFPKQQAKVS